MCKGHSRNVQGHTGEREWDMQEHVKGLQGSEYNPPRDTQMAHMGLLRVISGNQGLISKFQPDVHPLHSP